MAGPPVLNGQFTMPMYNSGIPKKMQPWLYLFIAFSFQMSGSLYAGALTNIMGDTCMMREDVLMIVLCGVVGVNMPFPFLFRFKFRYTNRQLLMNAALVVAVCNILCTMTECIPLLCAISYLAGFFKLCGTFECMSNIQLWMTPKRDFAIFFPLLYCVVLGNMSLSPWLAVHVTYITQNWQAMNWLMAGIMIAIALFVYLATHDFRFMKPLPMISMDWLGCMLWSALMIELIFIFNYAEYYNWWDGEPFRVCCIIFVITLYFTIQRMRHIRHPYISADAWKYKRLVPLLSLFVIVELINSTSKVLQGAFTSTILHFDTLNASVFNLVEWNGTICGCLFVMFWIKTLRLKYTKLLALGTATLLAYEIMMYFRIYPGLDIYSLFPPIFCRTFGVGIFFTALTIYLEDIMPFQHFFMGLTMVGLIRNGVVETVCSGVYSFYMRHNITENLSRGIPYDTSQVMMISIKQLFGVTCIIGIVVLFGLLLWDLQPVRSTLKKMPYWNVVGRMLRKSDKRNALNE